jgi:CheY-like chemotaxis protein
MLLKGKSIFIVEDNAQNRIVFQMSLIRHGALIDFERWGADTIVRLRNLPKVDLIILDLMLAEGVSGFDVYDQIRTLPKYAKVPIVAVSAMDPAVAVPKVQSKGFNGFIAKPIEKNLFPFQIGSVLDGKQVWHWGKRETTLNAQ